MYVLSFIAALISTFNYTIKCLVNYSVRVCRVYIGPRMSPHFVSKYHTPSTLSIAVCVGLQAGYCHVQRVASRGGTVCVWSTVHRTLV